MINSKQGYSAFVSAIYKLPQAKLALVLELCELSIDEIEQLKTDYTLVPRVKRQQLKQLFYLRPEILF